MIDFLISIPGPSFLLIYVAFSAGVILLCRWFARHDKTSSIPTPEPTTLQAWELAYLKDGIKGAIKASFVALLKRELLFVKKDRKKAYLRARSKATSQSILEQEILTFFKREKPYADLFRTETILGIERRLSPQVEDLRKKGLLPTTSDKVRGRLALLAGLILLTSVAGTKIYFGISLFKPVTFLIILMIAAIITHIIVLTRTQRTTLARRLLATAQKRFRWSKSSPSAFHNNDDLVYAVALYGMLPVVGTELGTVIDDPKLFDNASNMSNGGCGGAGCSGGGGGGCSGGGGCGGGGCGGCGG